MRDVRYRHMQGWRNGSCQVRNLGEVVQPRMRYDRARTAIAVVLSFVGELGVGDHCRAIAAS